MARERHNLFWLQASGCNGDTMALLNADSPNITEAGLSAGIHLLWHPVFSPLSQQQYSDLANQLLDETLPLDILIIEGAALTGPDGSGMFASYNSSAKTQLIQELASRAKFIFAVGTCASFGGMLRSSEMAGVGMQFTGRKPGGFFPSDFRTRSGFPVINLPGCPAHPSVVIGTISAFISGVALELNEVNAPLEYFSTLVHQGCTRNEYHEFQIEDIDFGQNGCLFFHMGCHGPLSHGPCNKFLWNNRNCKTRNGSPCLGCTEPDFPQEERFFETPSIVGLPVRLPDGVDRPYFLAYKGIAAAAAPDRLRQRKTRV